MIPLTHSLTVSRTVCRLSNDFRSRTTRSSRNARSTLRPLGPALPQNLSPTISTIPNTTISASKVFPKLLK